MEMMLGVLYHERKRLEEKLRSAEKVMDTERVNNEKQLEVVNGDIDRLLLYIDRPGMQTFSELLFVDDIRLRVKQILGNMTS